MRQVINTVLAEKISVSEAISAYYAGNIVAYVTTQGTGIGVLQKTTSPERFGFVYHKYLVEGRERGNYKFEDRELRGSITKVVDAGRKVLVFESFKEFMQFAVKRTKL